jgi:hypothetical protein
MAGIRSKPNDLPLIISHPYISIRSYHISSKRSEDWLWQFAFIDDIGVNIVILNPLQVHVGKQHFLSFAHHLLERVLTYPWTLKVELVLIFASYRDKYLSSKEMAYFSAKDDDSMR